MNTLKEVFKYIKFSSFVRDKTGFNQNGGIRARMLGIGTNVNDKRTELTSEEKKGLKNALYTFAGEIKKAADKL